MAIWEPPDHRRPAGHDRAIRRRYLAAVAGVLVAVSGNLVAQIVTDGTVGPPASLTGPAFVIPDTLGTQLGGNLFHSFSDFNINTGESATFTSGFAGATDNVISRVTGSSPSTIDGVLRNTITGADFWFINPSGVVFGAGASLDMTASFYASTASFIELGDCSATPDACGRFSAISPAGSTLSVAQPTAFGFLGGEPGPVTVLGQAGDRAELVVQPGESMFLAGRMGPADAAGAPAGGLTQARLAAPEGRVDLVSVGGLAPGETRLVGVTPTPGGAPVTGVTDGLGSLALDTMTIDVSGVNGGRVYLRGSRIVLDGSVINANGSGAGNGGRVDVEAGEFRMVTSSPANTDGSAILVGTGALSASGPAGIATVRARTINIRDGGSVEADNRDGTGGSIELYGDSIAVSEGRIQASTIGNGRGGTILVGGYGSTASDLQPAISLTVTGNDGDPGNDRPNGRPRDFGQIRVDSDKRSDGDAGLPGEIRVAARSVRLNRGGVLFATNRKGTGLPGERGLIDVQVEDLYLEGGIAAQTFGPGPGSDLRIRGLGPTLAPARLIAMPGLAETGFYSYIQAGSSSNDLLLGNGIGGRPGNITVLAAAIEMGSEAQITNAINAFGLESSSGFRIDIQAGSLLMREGAFISSNTSGSASAGVVAIEADSLVLQGEGTRIEAISRGLGAAGDIQLRALSTLIDGGLVASTTFGGGNGGSIVLETDRLELRNGGRIDTSSRPELLGLLSTATFDALSYDLGRDPDLVYDSATGIGRLDPGEVQFLAFGDIASPALFIAAFDVLPATNPDLDLVARSGYEVDDDDSPLPGSGTGPLVRGATDAGRPVELAVTGRGDTGGYPFFEFEGLHEQAGDYQVLVQLVPITELPPAGDGGTITLRGRSGAGAASIAIQGAGSGLFSISAGDPATSAAVALAGAGDAGSISVLTSSMALLDGGEISVQSVGDGRAGSVDVTAAEIILSDSRISAEAPRALAGNVVLDVHETLRLTRSTISGESAAVDVAGGDFFIGDVPADRSTIEPPGAGLRGNIESMQALVLNDGSLITASSAAAGSGNIVIAADAIAISSNSRVTATGELFSIGAILADVTQIDAPDLLEGSGDLVTRCTPQQIENRSSLFVRTTGAGQLSSAYAPSGFGARTPCSAR